MATSKYLITGGTGFIGQNLTRKLNGDIYLFSRDEEIETAVSFQRPDYIFHLAAEIYDDSKMFDSNINLTYRLLEATKDLDYKALIIVGSSSEYGLKDHHIREDEVLEPFHLYSGTKGAAYLLALSYAFKYKKPIIIARPFSVYGKFDPDHRFIPTAIRCLYNHDVLPVAPGSHDFIHANDFVDGLIMMSNKPKVGQIYNFGTGCQFSNLEVVSLLEEITGKEMNYEKVPKMREFDTDCWVCDRSKAKELGWEPKINLMEGLRGLCRRT
jgi:nucleoside-diphosphate-sugar epimerase